MWNSHWPLPISCLQHSAPYIAQRVKDDILHSPMKSQPNGDLITHRGRAKTQAEGTELNGLTISHFSHFNFQSLSSPVTMHIYAHTMLLPLLQKFPHGTAWADVPPSSYLGTVYKSDHLGSVSSFENLLLQTPPKRLLCLLAKLYLWSLLRVPWGHQKCICCCTSCYYPGCP